MCWCPRLFFHVCNNLAERLCLFIIHQFYKLCCVCWKPKFRHNHHEINENLQNKFELIFHEPFYQDIDRNSAEKLLFLKQNGSFIIRPSNSQCGVATLSVVQDKRIFHLVIRIRRDGLLSLGSEKSNERCFQNLNELINFYVSNYLILQSTANKVKTQTLLLPFLNS